MKASIAERFQKIDGYNHDRDGISIPTRRFEYRFLRGDKVVNSGEIYAMNEVDFERRLKLKVLPGLAFDQVTYSEIHHNLI